MKAQGITDLAWHLVIDMILRIQTQCQNMPQHPVKTGNQNVKDFPARWQISSPFAFSQIDNQSIIF